MPGQGSLPSGPDRASVPYECHMSHPLSPYQHLNAWNKQQHDHRQNRTKEISQDSEPGISSPCDQEGKKARRALIRARDRGAFVLDRARRQEYGRVDVLQAIRGEENSLTQEKGRFKKDDDDCVLWMRQSRRGEITEYTGGGGG